MAADEAARPAARVRVQLRTRDRRHEVAGGIGVLLVSTGKAGAWRGISATANRRVLQHSADTRSLRW